MKRSMRRNQTNPMTFRERVDNFWYYYKIHSLVAVGIVLVGAYAWSVSRPSGPPSALNVEVIGGVYTGSQVRLIHLEHQFAVALFGLKGAKRHGISINVLPLSGDLTNPTNAQVLMGVIAQIAARAHDIFVLDSTDYHFFVKSHFLQNLRGIPQVKTLLATSGEKQAFGLLVSRTQKFEGFGFPKGTVVAVAANAAHQKTAVRFLNWLFGKSTA